MSFNAIRKNGPITGPFSVEVIVLLVQIDTKRDQKLRLNLPKIPSIPDGFLTQRYRLAGVVSERCATGNVDLSMAAYVVLIQTMNVRRGG